MSPILKNRLLLLLLPVSYIIFMYVFLLQLGLFYTTMPDPVYAYLMNGTNLASGHFEIGHFDHPGTPVQCFVAVIIFIKHFISGSAPLYQDVLKHTESYLFTCSIVMMVLLGSVLYYTGAFIYRHTKNIGTAIFFQLTPLFTMSMLEHGMYMKPEGFIIAAGTFFMAYLYINFINPESSNDKSSGYKIILVCGLFTGFLIATKISTTPIIILPLFLMKGFWKRILYVLTSVISFLILIIPVWPKFGFFYKWVKKIVTHDGLYGNGTEQVVDIKSYKANLVELFTADTLFTVIYLIISFAFILAIIDIVRKRNAAGIYSKAAIGIWAFITLLILVVAKQYKLYYLFPAGAAFTLGLIVAYKLFSGFFHYLLPTQKNIVPYSVAGLFSLAGMHNYLQDTSLLQHENTTLEVTRLYIETRKNIPVIIANTCEAAYIEPALTFGIAYTGNLASFYRQFEQKNYPNSYLYDVQSKRLLFWGREFVIPELFSTKDSVLVYSKGRSEGDEKEIMQELTTYNGIKLGEYKRVYFNEPTAESIYVIYTNKVLAAKLFSTKSTIYCDLEKLSADNSSFTATDGNHAFAKANQTSQKEHHSGLNSILLDKKNQYGLDLKFNVKPGDFVDVTIWRKATDHIGTIILCAANADNFYKGGNTVINTTPDGWEDIECKGKVPEDYKESTLNFYLFYDGNKEAYFDDITITLYPMILLNSIDIHCNLEKLTNDKSQFISDDGHYYFQKANEISTSEHHSGENSIHLIPGNPYGLDLNIRVNPGDSINASIWRKSKDKAASIVFSAISSKQFYSGGNTVINTDTTGWDQIQCNAKIPADYSDSTVHFYIYAYGKEDAFFDDLTISVYPVK